MNWIFTIKIKVQTLNIKNIIESVMPSLKIGLEEIYIGQISIQIHGTIFYFPLKLEGEKKLRKNYKWRIKFLLEQ